MFCQFGGNNRYGLLCHVPKNELLVPALDYQGPGAGNMLS